VRPHPPLLLRCAHTLLTFVLGCRISSGSAHAVSRPCWPLLQIRDVGSGAFGVCKLMEDITTGERVAVKLMERGLKVPHSARPGHSIPRMAVALELAICAVTASQHPRQVAVLVGRRVHQLTFPELGVLMLPMLPYQH
jgi:hypothetical protein